MATPEKVPAKKAAPAKKVLSAKGVVAKKAPAKDVGAKPPTDSAKSRNIWEYIKKIDLQRPSNKTMIGPDTSKK